MFTLHRTSESLTNLVQSMPDFREPYISGEYVLGSVLMAFGLSVGVYGGFVMDCIFTMCDYLDINCLTVKRRPAQRPVTDGKLKN